MTSADTDPRDLAVACLDTAAAPFFDDLLDCWREDCRHAPFGLEWIEELGGES